MSIQVRPQSGWIGAEIDGADLSGPLDPATVAEIRRALLQWKVVFFRDQGLDHEAHLAFARAFGPVTPAHPLFDPIEGYPEVYPIQRDRFKDRWKGEKEYDGAWHTDVTAAVNPPAASILRAEVVPPYGGDTQWSNLVAAYEGLSPSLRGYLDRLRARHRFSVPSGTAATDDYQARLARRPLHAEHPVVRVHPETGKRALFVNSSFTKSIVGLTPRESKLLLGLLFEQIARPRYTVRFKWEPGSVAFWDNRATAHLGPTDLDHLEFNRLFYRVTLEGDVPVGPDGDRSEALEGEPFVAA
ncbi:MAG TPA: TauD/TfdA family dioxygenase [Acidimicrobiales bacterium]|jgi:taurine dioxygenase|nr:TauD/TfdA family dioxygenase [Acidimicrobiales bacterium]